MMLESLTPIIPQIIAITAIAILTYMEFIMSEAVRRKLASRNCFIAVALIGVGAAAYSAAKEYQEQSVIKEAVTEIGRFAYLRPNERDLIAGKNEIGMAIWANGPLEFIRWHPSPLGVRNSDDSEYWRYRNKGGKIDDIGAGLTPITLKLPPKKFTIDMLIKSGPIDQSLEIVPFGSGWAAYIKVKKDNELIYSEVIPSGGNINGTR